jgi:hypothetical protein
MQNTKIAIWIIVLITVMGLILWWTNQRDAKLMEWADKYEACVAEQYHTTPSAWYADHGSYPECYVTNDNEPK